MEPQSVKNQHTPARVVHCADYRGPYSGSFVPMLVAAGKAARDAGYETTICFSEVARGRPWLIELAGLADVRFIERSGIRGDMLQLRRIIDESDRPTVLHTHFGSFDEATSLLRLQRRHTAVLWHAHSGSTRRIRLRSQAAGAVFGRLVNGVICVSPAMSEEMLARRFPPAKLRVLPNAIDVDRFPPISKRERVATRSALGIDPSAKVVLHFAWNWDVKGGALLLEVAGAMASDPDVTFLTVVGENARDVPEQELRSHAGVRAIGPRGEVNELYAAADAFLNCSRAEGGLPYAVLEALARGLPAVVTVPPVRRELVDGLPAGRAVRRDAGAVAAALSEVFALDSEQLGEHAEAARHRVSATYALTPWARRLVELYDEVLKR
jgi:glycosyltransferase involved in cell wall biosynthesis